MKDWFDRHHDRYQVIVAEEEARESRGKGIGGKLLEAIQIIAKDKDFHKIVLFTFPFNELGQGLYRKQGFREVGVFKNQGMLDGNYVDVMAMEKLLTEGGLK